jgi:rhamnulokinase
MPETNTTLDVIAVDLGNESGRVYKVSFDGALLQGEELYRFPNIPVTLNGTLYWDALRLWHEIQTGLSAALAAPVRGIGVDSFGVDFGLLDAHGNLISNPVHMRDSRTEGMMEWVFSQVGRAELYERTGIGFYVINTLYQLAAIKRDSPWQLDITRTLLTMPNLINFWLTGQKLSEFTHTTTTQCYNPTLADWDRDMLGRLGIGTTMFPPVVQPGHEIGLYQDVPVYTVAGHDTGSAVVAVPTQTPNFAYISSGTWSLFGLETFAPIITPAAREANITNEGGAYGTFRPLRMVMGLWLVQQCRARWAEGGLNVGYDGLLAHMQDSAPFAAFIDPDDARFFPPGDMPGRVRAFCAETGQTIPATVGGILRCVLESLALKYRYVLEKLIEVSGQPVDVLHIVGGGSQNAALCQMTADATNRPVLAGPVEATALGNGLVQLIAQGELSDIGQARAVMRASYPPTLYEPRDPKAWNSAYRRFQRLITTP